MGPSRRGHRAHAHVADVILEAWGPGLTECFEEAVAAVLGLCVDPSEAVVTDHRTAIVGPGSAPSMLLDLLDEVVFVLDTADDTPVRAEIAEREGALAITFELADPASVGVVGSAPKAISHSGLAVERLGDRVRCTFLVDV